MGAAENALDPLLLRDVEIHPLRRVGVVAENGNDRVALVEDDDSSVQIRHGDVVPLHGSRGRHPQTGNHLVDEVSLQVIVQEPPFGRVVAVADQ